MRVRDKKDQEVQLCRLAVSVPADFNFWRTVLSHGWSSLPPFHLEMAGQRLHRVLNTDSQTVLVEMYEAENQLEVHVQSHDSMELEELGNIRSTIETMFRLNEPLDPLFAALTKKGNSHFAWIPQVKAGRILRGPNLFEDVIKMICTTNCAWGATVRMVSNLVSKLGRPFNQAYSDFPTPAQLASTTDTFLSNQIRCGYRSSYILQFAESVASGKLSLERWNFLDSESLYQELISIKGIGPYAAGNLMRLLGHYQHLALDSWCRQRFSKMYKHGRTVSDKTILGHYRHYGQWKGLVMWLDLTKDWFDDERTKPI